MSQARIELFFFLTESIFFTLNLLLEAFMPVSLTPLNVSPHGVPALTMNMVR